MIFSQSHGSNTATAQGAASRRGLRHTGVVMVAAVAGGLFCGWLWWTERAEARLDRGLRALQRHDWEQLQYAQVAIERMRPLRAENSLFLGALKLQAGELRSAVHELSFAGAKPARRAAALVLAGQAQYAEKRFREAEFSFNRALQIDPDLSEAHRWLAIAYYDIGLIHQAIAHLQRVAELDPSDPRPHRVMAVIHMDRGSYALAAEDFEESLRRDPHQVDRDEILLELSQTQVWLRRYDDAWRTLQGCQEAAEVCAMRAECCYARGEPAAAERWAGKALQLDPQQRLGAMVMGKIGFDRRDFAKAVEMLGRASRVSPADYDLRYSYVVALRAAGESDRAQQELDAVEKLRALRDQFDKLQDQAAKNPYNAELRYQLGVLADDLKMGRMAEGWFKAAVALDANHRLARRALEARREPRAKSFDAAAALRGA